MIGSLPSYLSFLLLPCVLHLLPCQHLNDVSLVLCNTAIRQYNDLISRRGGNLMPMTYPKEFKIKAVRRYENGESIKSLSQELDVSQSTLYHWRNQYCTIQTPTRSYTPAEFNAIAKHLKKLEHMLEIIRLSGFLARVPLPRKSYLCWSICITRWVISIPSKNYVRH